MEFAVKNPNSITFLFILFLLNCVKAVVHKYSNDKNCPPLMVRIQRNFFQFWWKVLIHSGWFNNLHMSWNQFNRQRFLVKHIACSNTTAILFFYISNFSFPVETAGSCVALWVRSLYKVDFFFYTETYLLDLLMFLLFGHQSPEKISWNRRGIRIKKWF